MNITFKQYNFIGATRRVFLQVKIILVKYCIMSAENNGIFNRCFNMVVDQSIQEPFVGSTDLKMRKLDKEYRHGAEATSI